MTVLNTYWFNGGGIVQVKTEYDGIVYYIGTWGPLGGMDAVKDANFIADYGNSFPKNVGDALFGTGKSLERR
jgi:hypothetical protein